MKNQTASSLMDVDKQNPAKPKRKREKIVFIEIPPAESWFQQAIDDRGRPVWFLRLQITGLRNRRYGPFATQHKGLLFLDSVLNQVGDTLSSVGNDITSYQVKECRFGYRGGHYPIVEDEVIEANIVNANLPQTAVRKKGR